MARLIYTDRALEDFERVVQFLLDEEPTAALQTYGLIEEAIDMLARHPLIGRPVEAGLRELLISRGRSGYLALYSYERLHDTVLILAIRHQREVQYPFDLDT